MIFVLAGFGCLAVALVQLVVLLLTLDEGGESLILPMACTALVGAILIITGIAVGVAQAT